jgi:uncharacterized protein
MGMSVGRSLPERFPIFPLEGALLLPGGHLPLHVFEPRYLRMTRDALRTDRVIGMIQPKGEGPGEPPIFRTGCVGRIGSCAETEDGRFMLGLTGVSRFDVLEELAVDTPYRQVRASFDRWRDDVCPSPPSEALRGALIAALEGYFAQHDIAAEWTMIESAPLAGLITSLAMICPFRPSEKQALLEAPTLDHQGRILVALMRMEALGDADGPVVRH